jgi:hypothetical protein
MPYFFSQDYASSEFSIVSSPNSEFSVENTLTLTDSEGLKLTLRIHYTLVIVNNHCLCHYNLLEKVLSEM